LDCIERKLPDSLYNFLSKKDITTLANLKEAAMIIGHWDADLLTIINPNVKITEGIREVRIKIITIKNIILSRIVIQDIIAITIQTIQQILKVYQTEIKFPLETKVIII